MNAMAIAHRLDAPEVSYERWLALDETAMPYEVVNGRAIMTPAPAPLHQRAVTRLVTALSLAASPAFEVLAGPVLLQLEGSGADAPRPELGERHVGRVDRRVAGGEHEDQRGLRPVEPEDDGGRVRRLDGLDVLVPEPPGVRAELALRVGGAPHEVERVLHVRRREGPAVVPLHVAPELERERPVPVLPRPALRQLGDERVGALLPPGGIEVDEVVEARTGRLHRRDRRLLVRGQARRRGERRRDEHPARPGLRGLGGGRRDGENGEQDHDENDSGSERPWTRHGGPPRALRFRRLTGPCGAGV